MATSAVSQTHRLPYVIDSHKLAQIDKNGYGKVIANTGRLAQCLLVCKGTQI